MAQGADDSWFGRTKAEFLKANTIPELKALCQNFGVPPWSYSKSKKADLFDVLRDYIINNHSQRTPNEILIAFKLIPSLPPQVPPQTTGTGIIQGGNNPSGNPGVLITQAPPPQIIQAPPPQIAQGPAGTQGQPPLKIEEGAGSGSKPVDKDVPEPNLDKPRARVTTRPEDAENILRPILQRLEQTGVFMRWGRGLDIDPDTGTSAHSIPSNRGLIVTKLEDFRNAWKNVPPAGPGPDISFVRMWLRGTPQQYDFAADGPIHAYRGRGPIWQNNSCALDCCIVAGMFLDAGYTIADRGSQSRAAWAASLTTVQTAFITAVKSTWNTFSPDESRKARDDCFNALIHSYNKSNQQAAPNAPLVARGKFLPAVGVWSLCSMNFHQFTFVTKYAYACTSCKSRTLTTNASPLSSVNIEIRQGEETKADRPSIQQLLRRYFGLISKKDCPKCGNKGCRARRRALVGDLPPRLVVQPHPSMRYIPNSASDQISFEYEDEGRQIRRAVYRWLGGIYQYKRHYRTYWNDCNIGETSRHLRLYDGQYVDGIILGGIAPANSSRRRVPPEWDDGADLLFYERVDNEVMADVLGVIQAGVESIKKRKERDDGETEDDPKKRKIEG